LRLLALRFLSVEMKEVARLTPKNSLLMRITKIGKGLLGFWRGYLRHLIKDELWIGLWVDVASILGFVELALNEPLKGEVG
jgi:hypothetical protein